MSHPTGVPEIDRAFDGGLPPGIILIEDKTGGALRLLENTHNVVSHSYDLTAIRPHFQAGTDLLVVPLGVPHGGVPSSLETTLGVLRGSHPTQTLVLVVDSAAADLVRQSDVSITVAGDVWHIIKSRALGTIKSSQFEVTPRPAVAVTSVRIPTGLVALDAALGGGLPQGLAVVRGNKENIARVRQAMQTALSGNVCSFRHGGPIDTLPVVVGSAVDINASNKEMLILDFGDMTKKFPFDPAQVRGPMISVSDRALDCLKPVCVLIEAHINREADVVLVEVADVVLKATDEGPWYIQKPYGGKVVSFEDAEKFDPLEVPKVKTPMTPDRVLNALMKEPALFIEVAKRMKVALPWKEEEGLILRQEAAFQFVVLRVQRQAGGWTWSHFHPGPFGSDKQDSPVLFHTAEEAKQAGDVRLRDRGWLVL
jgi:hypothetical protein